MNKNNEERLVELEIQLAWQNDLLDSLNNTVTQMQRTLDIQQEQLRLLYRRLNEKGEEAKETAVFDPAAEIPPHY